MSGQQPVVKDDMCDCDMDNWTQVLHPDLDPEVDVPVWQCSECGATGTGW